MNKALMENNFFEARAVNLRNFLARILGKEDVNHENCEIDNRNEEESVR